MGQSAYGHGRARYIVDPSIEVLVVPELEVHLLIVIETDLEAVWLQVDAPDGLDLLEVNQV